MKSYQPSMPRAALGIAAVGMTAATLGLFVLAPATMEHDGAKSPTQAAITAPQNVELAVVVPMRIEVRGVRDKAEIAVTHASQVADVTSPESSSVYRVSASGSGPLIVAGERAWSEGRSLRMR